MFGVLTGMVQLVQQASFLLGLNLPYGGSQGGAYGQTNSSTVRTGGFRKIYFGRQTSRPMEPSDHKHR